MRSRRFPRGRLITLALLAIPLVALVLLALSFVHTMDHRAERHSGSNSVKLQQPVVQILGGSTVCQDTLVPRDTETVMLFVAPTRPTGPPMTLTIADAGRQVTRGHIRGGWVGGIARFAVARVRSTVPDAQLCIRNDGRAPLAFGGIPSDLATLTVDGKTQHAALSIEFFRGGTPTWWATLPAIAHRAGVLKGSLAGAWGFWFAVGLLALGALLALGHMLRSVWK